MMLGETGGRHCEPTALAEGWSGFIHPWLAPRAQGQGILERKDLSLSSVTRKLSPAGMKPVEPAIVGRALSNGSNGSSGATDHIKRVPQPKSLRERLRRQAAAVSGRLDPARAATKTELDSLARELLADLELPEAYVGWTMVMLATAFWQPKVVSVQHDRRLLLLPGNLAHSCDGRAVSRVEKGDRHLAAVSKAGRRRTGARSQSPFSTREMPVCAACGIAWLRAMAEELGYRVLWAEESVAVLTALAGAEIDALLGVASLDLLEKAIDQIPQFDIPCMAIPLLDTSAVAAAPFDADWVRQMIELPYEAADDSTPNYRHLMRAARRMFEPDELEHLAPRMRSGPRLAELNGHGAASLEPLAGTEAIAYDFLTRGGKHSRPFITLAVYDAMTGGRCTLADGHRQVAELPLAVKRAAVSIETFHKASLVHDDIEDDDQFRYGEATLHRARRADGDQCRRFSDRARLSPGEPRERRAGGGGRQRHHGPPGRRSYQADRGAGRRVVVAGFAAEAAFRGRSARDLRFEDRAGFRGGIDYGRAVGGR